MAGDAKAKLEKVHLVLGDKALQGFPKAVSDFGKQLLEHFYVTARASADKSIEAANTVWDKLVELMEHSEDVQYMLSGVGGFVACGICGPRCCSAVHFVARRLVERT